jgi:hypothetical protein
MGLLSDIFRSHARKLRDDAVASAQKKVLRKLGMPESLMPARHPKTRRPARRKPAS